MVTAGSSRLWLLWLLPFLQKESYTTLRNPFGYNANSGNLPKDTAKVGGEPVDGVLNLGGGLITTPLDTFKQNFKIIQHTVNNEK